MARPTKLTQNVQRAFVKLLEAGNYREIACRAVGVHPSSFYRWMERAEREPDGIYGAFRQAVERAEAEAEVEAVAVVRTAMVDDWRAALTYLERRYPGRWRRRQTTELTGADGGPIITASSDLDLSKLNDDQLAQLEELRNRALAD